MKGPPSSDVTLHLSLEAHHLFWSTRFLMGDYAEGELIPLLATVNSEI